MDFITSQSKYDVFGTIMVMVDRFSKYATFLPATAGCTAKKAARLFFKNVVKYWGCQDISLATETLALPGFFRESC